MKDYLSIERGRNRWKFEDKEDFSLGGGCSAKSTEYSKKEENPAEGLKTSLEFFPLIFPISFALTGLIFFGAFVSAVNTETNKVKKMAVELIKKESLGIPFFPELSKDEDVNINYGKGLAFRIADDGDYKLSYKELYQLGKGLEVITNKEKISEKLLKEKIRDTPIERYKMYIRNYFENN